MNVEMPATEEATEVDNKPTEDGSETGLTFEADAFSLYAVVIADTIQTRYISADGRTWQIELAYGADANIPAGAELRAGELIGSSAADYTAQAAEALDLAADELTYAKALDISIVKDGRRIQPDAPVKVSIKLLDAPEQDDNTQVNVLHFGEEVKALDCALNEGAVEFDAEGF